MFTRLTLKIRQLYLLKFSIYHCCTIKWWGRLGNWNRKHFIRQQLKLTDSETPQPPCQCMYWKSILWWQYGTLSLKLNLVTNIEFSSHMQAYVIFVLPAILLYMLSLILNELFGHGWPIVTLYWSSKWRTRLCQTFSSEFPGDDTIN